MAVAGTLRKATKKPLQAPAVVTPPEAPNDPTTALARRMVAGTIVVGQMVRYAAERHLRDLRDGPKRGLHWSVEEAGRPLRFFPPMLSITAGAAAGKPFTPLDWHSFTIGSLYGWRRADGLRRYRTAWLETGKGQAKSPLVGAATFASPISA
jgi:phage terminase large subunit-like protein